MEKNRIHKFVAISTIRILILTIIIIGYYNVVYSYNFSDSELMGKAILIPTDIPQYHAQVESYHNEIDETREPGRKEGNAQYDVRKLWEEQGSPISQNIAYVTLAGQPRYIVAIPSTFGNTGDYIDIILTTGQIIPCVMGDSKSAGDPTAYFHNGVHYGHTYEEYKCNIVEFILGTNYGPSYSNAPEEFIGLFDKVHAIANGGSYFLHTDGPVGLEGDYEYIVPEGYAYGSANKSKKYSNEFSNNTFKFIRSFWEFALSLLEQEYTGNHNFFINYRVVK